MRVTLAACAVVLIGGTTQAQVVTWDTISTGCLRLVVGSNGEMGHNGIGKANMDYVAFGGDCDTTATVYLKSGGPFVIRFDGTNYFYSSALWSNTSHGFIETSPMTHFSTADYSAISTGLLLSGDSTVGVQVTYYAPTAGGDNCKFIIQKTIIVDGPAVHPYSWYTVGEFLDWDVPSASMSINTASVFPAKGINYQGGIGLSSNGCQSQTRRIAAASRLSAQEYWSDSCGNNAVGNGPIYFADSIRAFDGLSNAVAAQKLWNGGGIGAPGSEHDFVSSVLYGYGGRPGTPRLTNYSALITIQDGDTANLRAVVDAARKWHADHLRPSCSHLVSACCLENSNDGRTGNIDCSPDFGVDISDLSRLIDYTFLQGPPLCCLGSADLIWDNIVDIADLTDLIDFLYIRFSPTGTCR